MLTHLLSMLRLCWPILATLGPCCPRGYVGPPCYVGAMLAHFGAMWGYVDPSSLYVGPSCRLCWTFGYTPPRWFWAMWFSWLHLQIHFCNTISLKKLNPAWDGRTTEDPEVPRVDDRSYVAHGRRLTAVRGLPLTCRDALVALSWGVLSLCRGCVDLS